VLFEGSIFNTSSLANLMLDITKVRQQIDGIAGIRATVPLRALPKGFSLPAKLFFVSLELRRHFSLS